MNTVTGRVNHTAVLQLTNCYCDFMCLIPIHSVVNVVVVYRYAPLASSHISVSSGFQQLHKREGVLLICFFFFLSCLLEAVQIESCGGGAENDEVDVECFAGRFFTLAVCLKLREAERFMQKKRTPAFMNHTARLQQRGFTLSLYL